MLSSGSTLFKCQKIAHLKHFSVPTNGELKIGLFPRWVFHLRFPFVSKQYKLPSWQPHTKHSFSGCIMSAGLENTGPAVWYCQRSVPSTDTALSTLFTPPTTTVPVDVTIGEENKGAWSYLQLVNVMQRAAMNLHSPSTPRWTCCYWMRTNNHPPLQCTRVVVWRQCMVLQIKELWMCGSSHTAALKRPTQPKYHCAHQSSAWHC